MRKRQFGQGTLIEAGDFNTSQDYAELNAKELAVDGKIKGVISGCTVIPDPVSTHTIIISSSILRTNAGERIIIPYDLSLILEPTTVVTSTGEFWLTVFVDYAYNRTLPDNDTDGVPYYKQYDNWFVISTEEGAVSSTGTAVKPSESSTGLVICDILYDSALVSTGLITTGDIDISRQFRNSNHYHNNFNELELITDGLHETRTTNPHSVTKTQVGLGNVTNNAQVIKIDNSTIGNIPTWATSTGDYLTSTGYSVENTLIGSASSIANSHAAKSYIDTVLGLQDALTYLGEIDCSINPNYPAGNAGDVYDITSSGLIGGSSGKVTSTGDIILCLEDNTPSGDEASVGEFWIVIQGKNDIYVSGVGKAVSGEIAKFLDTSGRRLTSSGFFAQEATTSVVGLIQLSNTTDFKPYWSVSSGELSTARSYLAGSGVQSAALSFGGKNASTDYASTEEFNGTSWSTAGDLNTARYALAGCGILGASLSFGGTQTSTGDSFLTTEKFDGSTWTTDAGWNLNIANTSHAGCGTQNSALSFGGFKAPHTARSEKFNGLSWSEDADLNTSRYRLAGCGIQNAALSFGGDLSSYEPTAITEKFNGTAWSYAADLNTSRFALSGCGLKNAALSFGGSTNSDYLTTTEQFNGFVWSSAESLNTGKSYFSGCGTKYEAASFGGNYSGGVSPVTETYAFSTASNLAITEVGLSTGLSRWSNVTNDAQLKRDGEDYITFNYKEFPVGTDIILVETSSTGGVTSTGKYKFQLSDISRSIDNDAIHKTSTGEIESLIEKFALVNDDILLIEDSEDSFIKKKVSIESLATKFYSPIEQTIFISSTGDVGELSITSTGSKTIAIISNLDYLNSFSTNVNTWSNSSNMNTSRRFLTGCGVQSAGLSFGGDTGSSSAVTEKFNGSSWTASGNLNTARQSLAGCGIQNAGLSFGGLTGSYLAVTEKFNGTSWSTDAGWDLNIATTVLGGCGTQNSGLSFGGNSGSYTDATEKFNGSTWSTDAGWNLNTARGYLAGTGVQSAALSFGGETGSNSAVTEKFNGSTWIETGNLNIARYYLAGAGTQNATLGFGGNDGSDSAVTEKFNGSTWAATGNLNTARSGLGRAGTQNSALSFGGGTTISKVTEKFNEPYKLRLDVTAFENTTDNTAIIKKEISTYESMCSFKIKCPVEISYGIVCERELSTLSSTGTALNTGINVLNYGYWVTDAGWNLNTARFGLAGAGLQNSGLSFGGTIGSVSAVTEKFDGSAWANSGNLNTARNQLAGCGSQNSALSFGGTTGSNSAVTEKFDGSSWTASGNLNTARYILAGAGAQNAALSFGGTTGSVSAVTEKFDGSAWASSGNLNTARGYLAGCGSQNAALSFGGAVSPALAITEKFNGYTWSYSSSLNTARITLAGSGTIAAALSFGGSLGSVTEKFNSFTWLTTNSLNTARNSLGGVGSQTSSLSFGGTDGSDLAITEKFNYNRDISELYGTVDCYVDKSNVMIEY